MEEMSFHADAEGFFLTGFPKDIVQAQEFEEQVGDCMSPLPQSRQ